MKKTILLAIGVSLFGCAKTYKPITPDTLQMGDRHTSGPLDIKYTTTVLEDTWNYAYTEKMYRSNLELVAFSITNKSNENLTFSNDLLVTSNEIESDLFPTSRVSSYLKQKKGKFAWWLLLMLVNGYAAQGQCSGGSCSQDVTFIPIGLIIGPLVTLIHFGIASSADGKIKTTLEDNDCLKIDIKPGRSVTCFAVMKDIRGSKLRVKLKKEEKIEPEPSVETEDSILPTESEPNQNQEDEIQELVPEPGMD